MQVESIVSQRYGPPACRIFRIIEQKHFLEQKQASGLVAAGSMLMEVN